MTVEQKLDEFMRVHHRHSRQSPLWVTPDGWVIGHYRDDRGHLTLCICHPRSGTVQTFASIEETRLDFSEPRP